MDRTTKTTHKDFQIGWAGLGLIHSLGWAKILA
ncbi:uncharacterized protein G2W53_031733 [Senna tora]|uniref:Uncharacterized protein n=1 Tax=Senna tora TaxID=362788 RepID=A0A834W633_9FABA|nr:uncharacterized protein G2W53_031733 [Senna tora]